MNSNCVIDIHSAASDQLAALSAINKAAGDTFRLQVLRVLRRNSFGVVELASIFSIGQSGMSHHLKVLANAGLVIKRREGNSIFYHRAYTAKHQALEPLQLALLEAVDGLPLEPAVEQQIAMIHQQREHSSQQFFELYARAFSVQQELIAELDVYARPIVEMLDNLPAGERYSALEIGPGAGLFLAELVNRFNDVIALDNSREMLDAAEQFSFSDKFPQHKCQLSFKLGDSQQAISDNICVQNIIVNMVLHHVASPAELIRDASALLNDNGNMFIAELCKHNQDWVRESCGDLWLGFAPEDISNWAHQANMHEHCEGQYLSLRNGFRLQIRHFKKTSLLI